MTKRRKERENNTNILELVIDITSANWWLLQGYVAQGYRSSMNHKIGMTNKGRG